MKLERLPEVQARVGIRRSKIYDLIREGRFPKPVPIGSRAVGWLEDEIDDWIRERIAESRNAS